MHSRDWVCALLLIIRRGGGRPLWPPKRHQQKKSVYDSVGAREVEMGGVGLYGILSGGQVCPCSPCLSAGNRWSIGVNGTPGAGGHKGPHTTPRCTQSPRLRSPAPTERRRLRVAGRAWVSGGQRVRRRLRVAGHTCPPDRMPQGSSLLGTGCSLSFALCSACFLPAGE
jgi:hypothetical protein